MQTWNREYNLYFLSFFLFKPVSPPTSSITVNEIECMCVRESVWESGARHFFNCTSPWESPDGECRCKTQLKTDTGLCLASSGGLHAASINKYRL